MKKPHLVIFNPDQFRGDVLGHMDNPAAITPNFDYIIRNDAVSFSNAFCQSPLCGPSRCSFMTGWYPHVKGHRIQHYLLRKDEPMLLKSLKQNGYFVWWGGKNDLVPGQKPFDTYCNYRNRPQKKDKVKPLFGENQIRRGNKDSDNYYSHYYGKIEKGNENFYYDSDWDNVLSAVRFIQNYNFNEPMCLYLSLVYPHPPYSVEEPWYSMIDRNKVPKRIPTPENWENVPSKLKGLHDLQRMQGWTEERWNELRATYYGMCSRVDYQFGLLVDALKQKGIYDETAIFIFSDHGDFAGDYGLPEKNSNTFQDCLTRVPFIIKPPASIPVKPGINHALVELTDFIATVEDFSGIEMQHTHFGKTLKPLILGATINHREFIFSEGGILHGETHCTEQRGYKAATPPGEGKTLEDSLYWPYFKLNNCVGPHQTKSVMIRSKEFKYVMRLYEEDEFYDLINDPDEVDNKIKDCSYQKPIMDFRYSLLKFFLKTCDVVPFDLDERFEVL